MRFDRGEISGSLGDLGTFLPLTLGYITRCGLSPAPVFFFAGLELSLPARDTGTREDFLVCLLTAGLILSVNVTLGFLAGVLLWAIFRRWNNAPGRKEEANR